MDRISLPYWVIALLLLAYMGALFVIAWRGDHSARPSRSRRLRTLTYALSLGIYCTSWTYYGAVGTAERAGWEYLGVYIGPVLTFAFLFPLWRRVLVAAKREKAGSIADFLAARYSKSHVVGALVTAVAVVASLPYISLQLKSLTMAWYIAMGSREGQGDLWITLVLAGALAAFAVLFGASRIDLTEHRRGLSQAVAVESVVKLFGVILVAILALGLLWSGPGGTSFAAFEDPFAAHPPSAMRLVTLAVLSGAAIFCVPRQFQMGFVEAEDVDDVTPARWIFPLYLLLFSLAVIPIAVAGQLLVPASSDPDFYVLTLPLHHTGWAVTLVVLLGGFSAAAAMVVVETVALSAMVSNHLVLPLAERWLVDPVGRLAGRAIVILRQIAVLLIVALATGYFIVTRDSTALSSTGEISFAGAFQLAPALVAAVLWRRAHALGAIAGIIGGTSIWIVTLLLPQSGYGAPALLERAGAMLGVEDMLTLSAGLSLSTNVALLVGVSLLATPRLGDRIQAAAFVAPGAETARPSDVGRRLDVSVRDFKAILERFLGEEPVRRGLESFERQYGRPVAPDDPVSPLLARSGEKMLAGALGSTSARKVIGRALSNGRNDPEAVAWFLDEAAQAVQFNRDLLQATLDNLSQGVSVVDADLRLVAWNSMYVDMFGIPPSAVYASAADRRHHQAHRDPRRAPRRPDRRGGRTPPLSSAPPSTLCVREDPARRPGAEGHRGTHPRRRLCHQLYRCDRPQAQRGRASRSQRDARKPGGVANGRTRGSQGRGRSGGSIQDPLPRRRQP
nr:PAS-domain containing protein [Sphingopyxis sp. PET50]